jgi:decaprenyl-phosphate phosphoribosyltransferase
MLIASGFVLRMFAGAVLIAASPSHWIIIGTALIALFLALAKRRDDLVQEIGTDHRRSLGGYSIAFLDVTVPIILGVLLVSYIMYTTSHEIIERFDAPHLYTTGVFVVAGMLRYLQLSLIYNATGEPADVILRDPFMMAACGGWMLAMAFFIYV